MDTKRIIVDAFIELLHHVPFQDITTQMILDRSGVSRSTFYRHFKDKYDLMDWQHCDFMDQIVARHKPCRYKDAVREVFQYMRENPVYFKRVITTTGANSYYQSFRRYAWDYCLSLYKTLLGQEELTPKEQIQLSIIVDGGYSMLTQFVGNGLKDDPEQLIDGVIEQFPAALRRHIEA